MCTSSNPAQVEKFLGFFSSRTIKAYQIVDDLGKVVSRSRSLLDDNVKRLSSLSASRLDPEYDGEPDGGFQAFDEVLMTEAFAKAEHYARLLGANAIIGLRCVRKEVGSFVITGRAVYLAPLTPESPTFRFMESAPYFS